MMKMLTLLLVAVLVTVADQPAAQQVVTMKGIAAKVKFEEVVSGHLAELNGKYKLRVTEVTFEPGGHLGEHHHAGPGIRYVASGTVTFTQAGTATIYKAGDYFFESGNVVHTAHNTTRSPARAVFFEILPSEWASSSVILPKAY